MNGSKLNRGLFPTRTRKNVYLALSIVLVLIIGISLLSRFLPSPVRVPSGWKHWPDIKATFAIVETKEGILVGSIRGLFLIDESGSVSSVRIPGLKTQTLPVNALLVDKKGTLWVGHNMGLSIRIGSKWVTISESDGLPHHSIACLAEASNGNIWAGTLKGAIQLPPEAPWNKKTIRVFTTDEGLLDNIVLAVLEDTNRGVWLGNYAAPNGGLNLLKDGKWRHWLTKDGLPHPNVTSIMEDRSGRIWVGCGLKDSGGAVVYNYKSGYWNLEKIIPTDELTSRKVRYIFEDDKERFWLGAETNGLTIRRNNKTLAVVRQENGLPAGEIMFITQSSDEAMWLGTSNGPVRISSEAVEKLMR